ncbi:MAG: EAL domain-containing protein [Sulfurimonas sp.]
MYISRATILYLLFSFLFVYASPLEQNDTITLQLKWKHAFQFAGFYMAKEKGFYQDVGLEVTFKEKSPDINIADEVISGRAEYGVSDSALVLDRIEGKKVIALRAIFQHSPLALVALRSSTIHTINDIPGHRVMISPESHQNVSLMAMLKSHHIDDKNIKIIPMSFDLNDLINGRTDLFTGYTTDQPYTLEKKGIAYLLFSPMTYGFDFYGDILFTSEAELLVHPDRVKKFVEASMKGWYYAFEHREESIETILKKYNTQQFDEEKLRFEAIETRKISGIDEGDFGKIDEAKLKEIANAFAILGYVGDSEKLKGMIYQTSKDIFSTNRRSEKSSGIPITEEEQRYLNEKSVIRFCYPSDLKPFSFLKEGKLTGIAAEYVALFENYLGIPMEAVPSQSVKESIEKTIEGECDLHLAMISSKQLADKIDFTIPYIDDSIVLATKSDEVFIPDLTKLKNKRVGVLEKSSLYYSLKDLYPSIEFVPFKTIRDGLDALNHGEIFGYTSSMVILSYLIQHEYPAQLRISGKFNQPFSWSLGIHKNEPILLTLMNRLVRSIEPDVSQRIFSRWVSVKYEKGIDYILIWKIITGAILLFSALLLWNRRLIRHRRELEKHKSEIKYIAYHDTLTDLPNRIALTGMLEGAIETARQNHMIFAILFIDLDRFKIINDTLGHHIGDQMIKIVSKRIKGILREQDKIARIGGDEFVVVIEKMKEKREAAVITEKILQAINQVIVIDNYDLRTTASIGIAYFPEDGSDIGTLIKNADSAMYLAKEEGKNNYQYYTHALSEEIRYRMEIEHDLKNAIEKEEFSLEYQPQYDLETKKVIAVEALLRWKHAKYDMISPMKFIPIAEDSGFILQLNNWVFKEACRNFQEWKAQGIHLKHISINISGTQFNQENVVAKFQTMIKEIGIKAKEIELEITEHYIMEDIRKSKSIFEQLRKIGFKIAIDDFGTGYSSMSYLKKLPIDTIKIDKSFIDEIPDNTSDVAITKAILTLAKSLKYKVVAEGIESYEQEQFLMDQACDIGQGYLFSEPMRNEEFIRFMKNRYSIASSSETILR